MALLLASAASFLLFRNPSPNDPTSSADRAGTAPTPQQSATTVPRKSGCRPENADNEKRALARIGPERGIRASGVGSANCRRSRCNRRSLSGLASDLAHAAGGGDEHQGLLFECRSVRFGAGSGRDNSCPFVVKKLRKTGTTNKHQYTRIRIESHASKNSQNHS